MDNCPEMQSVVQSLHAVGIAVEKAGEQSEVFLYILQIMQKMKEQ